MEKIYERLQYVFMVAAIIAVTYTAIVIYGITKIMY